MHSVRAEELLIMLTVFCYLNVSESPLHSSGLVAGY